MNKVRKRSFAVLLLVAVAILGMGFYVVRLVIYGGVWASAPFNATIYRNGILAAGVVTDRNGVILADIKDGGRVFAASMDIRRATLHVVGDAHGNIGTGALLVFAPELTGFNIVTGSYSRTGAGRQIALTIDSNLNAAALKALNGRSGAVMVSNYETGEILCMVSSPAFDPADPPANIGSPAYEGIYVNRALQAAYTPGSVYKLVTAAAAIETVRGLNERIFTCNGVLETGRGTVTCPGEHGSIDFTQGMRVSCNVVFGELALEMGAGVLADYADRFNLSGRIDVSGIRTAQGNFEKASPNSADLAWSGVGQFTNTVCPAAMLRFVGAIANDGVAAELHYLLRSGASSIIPNRTDRIMSRNTANELAAVIEIQNRESFPNLKIHAKSGTAQIGGGLEPHAWYVGYITNENYPLAFVVIVENGGGGFAAASPIANSVLQEAISG